MKFKQIIIMFTIFLLFLAFSVSSIALTDPKWGSSTLLYRFGGNCNDDGNLSQTCTEVNSPTFDTVNFKTSNASINQNNTLNQHISITLDSTFRSDVRTVIVYIKPRTCSGTNAIGTNAGGRANNVFATRVNCSLETFFEDSGGTPLWNVAGTETLSTDNFNMVTLVIGTGGMRLLINTTETASDSDTSTFQFSPFLTKNAFGGEDSIDGLIDTIFMSNLRFDDSLILDAFNNGDLTDFQEIIDIIDPVFGATAVNNTSPRTNEVVAISQAATDNIQIDEMRLFHNQTGTFVNQTTFNVNASSFNATFNLSITAKNIVIGFGFWMNDSNDNVVISSVSTITSINTAPATPTIIFPTADLITNLQPLDINITFPADADGDPITITYYIGTVLNQTSSTNTTLNASDGTFSLSVSLNDDDNFFSPNATVSFTINSMLPTLTVTSPTGGQIFDKATVNILTVDLSCVAINITSLNFTIFNSTNTVIALGNNTNVDVDTLTLFNVINITPIGVGNYTFNSTCDNLILTDSQQFPIEITVVIPETPTQSINRLLLLLLTAGAVIFVLVGLIVDSFRGSKTQSFIARRFK